MDAQIFQIAMAMLKAKVLQMKFCYLDTMKMLLSQVKRISQVQVLLLKSMSTFSATLGKQCLSNDALQLSQTLEEPLKRSNSVYISPDNITIKSQFWT